MENCKRCGNKLENTRKHFCCYSCKYWFNNIKKHNESHLPILSKRNENYFYQYIGSFIKKGQGKRSGYMTTGAMSVGREDKFSIEPATIENLNEHFNKSQMVKSACFGNMKTLSRSDFFNGILKPT